MNGDFEFTPSELNTYLELSVTRMFPAVYQRKVQSGLSIAGYGTSSDLSEVTVLYPERVFRIEDASERMAISGWEILPTSIIGISKYGGNGSTISSVNVYYTDAYTLPADDVTDAGIANIYKPLIVLGALIEALESRHDTGVRPEPSQGHQEMPLVDRLQRRYDQLKRDLEMGLPAVIF